MKIQVLWVPPAERRVSSGDIVEAAQLIEWGFSPEEMIASREAQAIDEPAPKQPAKKKG